MDKQRLTKTLRLVECIELFKIEVKRKNEASSSLQTSHALLLSVFLAQQPSRDEKFASKEFAKARFALAGFHRIIPDLRQHRMFTG